MTKGEINRLGDKIRSEYPNVEEETLSLLEDYRKSYKDSLASIFNLLCRLKSQVGINTIITYRIKRFESIINKLDRFPKMQFSRMWDIGGCRCIVGNNMQVYKLKKLIEKNLIIRKENDYIENPQEDGYESLHLYVSLPNDNNIIELQIRNQDNHNWATLVEISDLLYDAGIKEYGKNKELYKFHQLLSKDMEDITYEEKVTIALIIKKYNYINKLSEVFTRNHLNVREQWFNIESEGANKYFLIQASKNKIPIIKAFSSFSEAENEYFETYQKNQKSNIILTHLQRPNYHHISVAYSNYILTMHSFEEDSANIYGDLVIQSLQKGSYRNFFQYYNTYHDIMLNRLGNSFREILFARKVSLGAENNKSKLNKKKKEWTKDIKAELEKCTRSMNTFSNKIKYHIPKNGINRICILGMVKYILWIHKQKIRKMLK